MPDVIFGLARCFWSIRINRHQRDASPLIPSAPEVKPRD
jgi:hypothetical protein